MTASMPEAASSKGPCTEKARLLRAYQQATQVHSASVGTLVQRVGSVSPTQYERLSKSAKKARHVANDARRLLDLHIAQHGC
jgi:hypothetical protein